MGEEISWLFEARVKPDRRAELEEAIDELVRVVDGEPGTPALHCTRMPAEQIDGYLRDLEEPKRATLEELRQTILEVVPEAEEVISYRVPAFRLQGEVIAGFAAFKDHLSYLPFSGSVLGELADELEGYTMTKSSLHFSIDRSLPKAIVERLITVRLENAGLPTR